MLKRENRLSTTYEFNKVRKFGTRVHSSFFDLFYLKHNTYTGPARIGVVVSNKFSSIAPRRNYIKRIFREMLRLDVEKVPNGYWLVVHPKPSALGKDYEDIRAEVNKVLSTISFSH